MTRTCVFTLSFLLVLCQSVKVTKQGTLYEWNPGDDDKANALGSQMIVGYYHDFVYLERRALFQFSENQTRLKLFFTIKPAENDVNLTVCEMLQDWGFGSSNPSNPVVGVPATKNDATWRYPFYGKEKLWQDHVYGGYFDTLEGVSVFIQKGATNFTVNAPTSKYGYLIRFTNSTKSLIHIYGIGSDFPPTAKIIKEPNSLENLAYLYYIIPITCLTLFLIGVIMTYVFMQRKRNEYMPLFDLEEGDIHLTQLQGIEKMLIDAKVKRIAEKDIQYGRRIGSGTTGEVFAAKLGNGFVAIKKIKLSNITHGLDKPKVISSISSEIMILSRLDHVNILTMIGLVIGEGYEDFGIVSRLMEQGNLTRVLYNIEKKLTLKQKLKIIQGIARGMLYLHKQNPTVIHRDLKPENILIADNYVPKITDFGISRFIEGTLQDMTISGTPSYMAPESFLRARGAFSKKSDVFSFGVIVAEIISEQRPNAGQKIEKIMIDRSQGKYTFELPDHTPKEIRQIVEDSTTLSPAQRPSFSDLTITLKKIT